MKAVAAILILSFFAFPLAATAADDGAALYKGNCAMCHKPDGSGNAAMKAPDLRSDAIQGMDDAKLADAIAKQPKHAAVAKKLNAEQVKAVVTYLRTLKK